MRPDSPQGPACSQQQASACTGRPAHTGRILQGPACSRQASGRKALLLASVASMVGQFNLPNIRLLQGQGYEVHVACNFRDGNTCDGAGIARLRHTLRQMHVHCHQWDCPRKPHALGGCLEAYRQLWRLTGQVGFGLIHCHSPIGGALARAVAHFRGIPVIYTAHGFHFYKGAPVKNWLLYYPVEKLLAYWTDVLVTINREDYTFARLNLNAGKIYRVPGVGIDIGRFAHKGAGDGFDGYDRYDGYDRHEKRREVRARYHIPQDAILLLSVGELSVRKNHRAVLEALAAMGRRDVYYLICGQGALEGWLARHARQLGVGGNVRFAGYVGHIEDVYRAADIFVFPSLQEGLPVALMEAMAAGLPILCSRIRGSRDLVRDGVEGLLVDPHDVHGLAHAISRMAACPELAGRCRANAAERVAAFSRGQVDWRMGRIYAAFGRGI